MFLDASIVVAILNRKSGFEELQKLLGKSPTALLYSPLSRFEAVVSIARTRAGPNRTATAAEIDTVTRGVDAFYMELVF